MIIDNTTNITLIAPIINETERKLTEATQINNIMLYLIIGIILAFTITSYFYTRNQKKKGETIKQKTNEIKQIIETLKGLEKEITINQESKKTIALRKRKGDNPR